MSITRLTLRCGCGLAALALAGAFVRTAEAGSRQQGRSIEFSQPKSFEVMTNLQQLATKKDALKQLEEDLYKPLQAFVPKSSLEGVVASPRRLPPPSAIQSKRAKELLERRRDWVFMTPEDLLSAPTVEQLLESPDYGPEGRQKRDLPALERYYQSLVPRRSTRDKPSPIKEDQRFGLAQESTKADAAPARDEEELPSGVKESAEALRNAFGMGQGDSPFAGGARPGSLADPFGIASPTPSREQLLERKKLMDEYRVLVDPSWRPPTVTRLVPPVFDLANAAQGPAVGLPTVAVPSLRKGPETPLDPLNPVLGPPPMPDVNAQALGQSRSALDALNAQPRRVVMPPPDFSAPRRAF